MTIEANRQAAFVGVVEHGNSAFLVTVSAKNQVLDRRKIVLTEAGLPSHPHHHEGSWAVGRYKNSPWAREVTLPEAVALVERVRKSANQRAQQQLADLANATAMSIRGIAIRVCPQLPPTIEACIRDNRAQTYADTVMYRQALAAAACARGWLISWYDRDLVFGEAEKIAGCGDFKAFLSAIGREIGPPWQAKHKLATAAAIAARGSVT